MDRIVVVGASLAGLRGAEALRRTGFTGSLTVVGEEVHAPYDRPPLSKTVLSGKIEAEKTALRRDDALLGEAVFLPGIRATGLDVAGGVVRASGDGGEQEIPFDGLMIATGAAVRTLPGTAGIRGVHTLRTLDDCLALRAELVAEPAPRVVVIGAGFIGAEVAATCNSLGLRVTVVEALELPLVRILGPELGRVCARLHTANGTDLRLGVGVDGLASEDGKVTGVNMADGTVVPADVVVVGIGVAPATGWLEGSGLEIDNGVVCDDRCRAVGGGGRIVAAGDVARWFNPLFGEAMRVEHWTNAIEMGEAAAAALLEGDAAPVFAPVPYFWSDQYGKKIQYVGRSRPDDELAVIEGTLDDERFVAALGRDGRTTGVFTLNRPAKIMGYRAAMAEGPLPFPPEPL